MKQTIYIVFLLLISSPVFARINVVTLPGRDSVQLTIYNSADLTLVRETRHLTFRKGLNKLEFSWANTLIDPTSVEFRALTHVDEVEILDVSFPPRVTNTLEWRISSEVAGEVQVEIQYFTSGISWSANYVVESDTTEKFMSLIGQVRVTNNSGEDYESAEIRLVVGIIRLVEEIADLARKGRPGDKILPTTAAFQDNLAGRAQKKMAYSEMAIAADEARDRPREIIKEGVSEYFLYTVEGRDTIPSGWSKQLPSFAAEQIPLISYYKYERERWGDQSIRYYRFKNDKKSNLGSEPLPDGTVSAYRIVNPQNLLSFIGNTRVKYVPIDELVELDLSSDLEVIVKPTLMNWEKTDLRFDNHGNVAGWTVAETWEIDVQNSKDIEIVVDLRRNFNGDWSLSTKSRYETVDANKVKFVIPLKPRTEEQIVYQVKTRYGLNATR